jgi:hypothetical protein
MQPGCANDKAADTDNQDSEIYPEIEIQKIKIGSLDSEIRWWFRFFDPARLVN